MSAARRPRYGDALRDWAQFYGLTPSSRQARCLHGLFGKSGRCDDPQCARRNLLDYPTLWNRNGSPVLLMVQVYAPTTFTADEPGQVREWWESEVHRYAARFGARVWIGRPAHPLSFWDAGRGTPVLYGRGVDPRDFTRANAHDPGVRRHRRRAPNPNITTPAQRRAAP